MFIKLELEVTPEQLTKIGQLLSGVTTIIPMVAITDDAIAEASEASAELAPTPPEVITEPATIAETFAADQEAEDTPPPPANFADETASTPPPPPATTDTGVELCKGQNGQQIPWDARIHGKAKVKNADGSWRLRQGIDRATLVPSVEAELVDAMSAPAGGAGAPSPKPAEAVNTPTPPPPQTDATVVPPATPVASTAPTTFSELLPLVTAAKANGTLTDEAIAKCCTELGLAQFGLIATRPDLIPQAAVLLGV